MKKSVVLFIILTILIGVGIEIKIGLLTGMSFVTILLVITREILSISVNNQNKTS